MHLHWTGRSKTQIKKLIQLIKALTGIMYLEMNSAKEYVIYTDNYNKT